MRSIHLAVFGLVLDIVFVPPAFAIKEFKKPFASRYVDVERDPDFAKAVRKANCNLCHIKGEKKNACNPYGEALDRLIHGNAHERLKAAKENGDRDEELRQVLAELEKAFSKVEQMADKEGRKYGDLLQQGLLPEVDKAKEGDEDEEHLPAD